MKKVTNVNKNEICKIIFSLLLFFLFCLGIKESIKNKNTFLINSSKIDQVSNLEISLDDKIEDIVGINSDLANFYLNLRSYEGDKDATHPKVIAFKKKWNGYKYWIAYTPYPKGNQAKENPHIMVSNDLVNWQEKKGFANPLDIPKDKDYKKVYNSDTHLLYNPDTNRLECYWRYVNDKEDKVIIYKRTTKNGINWTKKEIVLENTRSKVDYLSPSIIYENRKYMFWYVDRNRTIKYTEYNLNTKEWSEPRVINIKYENNKLESWHLDIIKTDNGYEMIIVAFDDFFRRDKMKLYYSKSEDNLNYTKAIEILKAPKGGGLYRSSILYINNTYYIFYSEITRKYKRGVGIVYGTDINKLNGLKIKKINKFKEYIKRNG